MARDSLGLGVEGGLNPRLGFRSRGVEGSFPLVPTRRALSQGRVPRSAARFLRKGTLIFLAARRVSQAGSLHSATPLAWASVISLLVMPLWPGTPTLQ